ASLDMTVGDNNTTLGEVIEDKDASSPENSVVDDLLKSRVNVLLDGLEGRDLMIIKMRFGLDGYSTHTLEEVGREFRISRERVRQIQDKVLGILRKDQDAIELFKSLD